MVHQSVQERASFRYFMPIALVPHWLLWWAHLQKRGSLTPNVAKSWFSLLHSSLPYRMPSLKCLVSNHSNHAGGDSCALQA